MHAKIWLTLFGLCINSAFPGASTFAIALSPKAAYDVFLYDCTWGSLSANCGWSLVSPMLHNIIMLATLVNKWFIIETSNQIVLTCSNVNLVIFIQERFARPLWRFLALRLTDAVRFTIVPCRLLHGRVLWSTGRSCVLVPRKIGILVHCLSVFYSTLLGCLLSHWKNPSFGPTVYS